MPFPSIAPRSSRWFLLMAPLMVAFTQLPAAASTLPVSILKERFDRLSKDPLLDTWERDFFARRAAHPDESGEAATQAQAPAALPEATQAGTPVWSAYVAAPQQSGHVTVYDAATDRVLIVGGETPSGLTADVWAFSMSPPRAWSRVATGAPQPSPRMGASVVLDSRRHRLVMFGGLDANGSYLDDVWMLPLDGPPAWQSVSIGAVDPGARTNHSAVYDSLGERMIVFGGSDGGFTPLAETWSLSLGDSVRWSPLTAPGTPPTGRSGHVALFDAVHHQMHVFGGTTGSNNEYESYVWSLSLGGPPAWTISAPFYYYSGPTGTDYRASYDPVNNAILAYRPSYGPVYQYSLAGNPGWVQLTLPAQPFDISYGCGFVLDPARGIAIVAGGHANSSTDFRSDVWSLPLNGFGAWTELFRLPPPRAYHAAAVDPIRKRMLVFGGYTQPSGALTNEVWALSLTNPPLWSSLSTLGTPPSARQQSTMIYDPNGDRMIVFGGTNGSLATNELWQLSLTGAATWTRLRPTGTLPHVRSNHAVAYDPAGKRMVIFGGYSGSSSTTSNDLWTLALTGAPVWTLISPIGTPPPPRVNAAMVYDDVADRMLVIGGSDNYYSYDYSSAGSIWGVNLSAYPAWSKLPTSNLDNAISTECAAIFEPVGHRVLRFGRGQSYYSTPDTMRTHSWTPGPDSLWTDLQVGGTRPPGVSGGSIVYDAETHRVIAFGGGSNGSYNLNARTWALSLGALPLAVPFPGRTAVSTLALAAFPNPTRSRLRLRFATPVSGSARISMVDLAGRVVFQRDLGDLPAGIHDVRVEARGTLAPGVYFATCHWGKDAATTRVAIVR